MTPEEIVSLAIAVAVISLILAALFAILYFHTKADLKTTFEGRNEERARHHFEVSRREDRERKLERLLANAENARDRLVIERDELKKKTCADDIEDRVSEVENRILGLTQMSQIHTTIIGQYLDEAVKKERK